MPAPSLRTLFPLSLTFFAALAVLILATGVSTSSAQTTINICDRTPEVRDAILDRIHDPQGGGSPTTTCEAVTEFQLRLWRFSPLEIEGYSSARIVPGDFEGILVGELRITNSPQLTTIPANAFSGLYEIETNVNANKLVLKNNAIDTIERGAFSGVKFKEDDYGLIDLSGNRIASLPADAFEGTTHLEWVNLEHNYIEFLDGGTFTGLSNLKALDLSTNNIQRLDPSIFAPLQNLDSVALRSNSLSSLPADLFDGLTSLRSLYLVGNELTSLPAGVFDDLNSLETLSLSGNSLSSLPENLFDGLTSLKNLYLDGNALTSLHKDLFDGLDSLTLLDLTGNRLTSLHADIFTDPPLKDLSLGLNQISTFPADVFAPRSSSLLTLKLNGNALTALDKDLFDGLTVLQQLWLHDNALTALDADLFDGLAALQQLWLRSNDLEDLDADLFDGLGDTLTLLTLDDNDFGTLPEAVFDGLENLVYLTLARAGLTSLEVDLFDGLDASLQWLYLHGNGLTALDADVFDGLTGLQRLYLHGNGLTTLDADVFDGLANLQQLDLNGNGLTALDANVFADLDDSLQQLILTNNSIPSLPTAVFTGLSGLKELDLSCNALTALDLTRFDPFAASLTFLDIRSNEFTTAPTEAALKAKLTAIQNLYFEGDNTDDGNCLLPYNAGLSGLSLDTGTLLPEFEAPGLAFYTTTVGDDVSSMTITPTPLDPDAVIGPYIYTGSVSGPDHANNLYWDDEDSTPDRIEVDLPGPINRVRWTVTPRNGSAADAIDYRLDVLRPYPTGINNALLSDLALSGLKLIPAFDSGTLTYQASVPPELTTTTVTATPLDLDATVVIKRNGVAVSGAFFLSATAETRITIEVTAEDGETTRTTTVSALPASLPPEQEVVGNLGQTPAATGLTLQRADGPAAQAFTVGAGDYTLTSIEIKFSPLRGISASDIDELTVSVHFPDTSGFPGTELYTLTNPASIAPGDTASFTAPVHARLGAGQTYIVRIYYAKDFSPGSVAPSLLPTESTAEDTTSGWSIADTHLLVNTNSIGQGPENWTWSSQSNSLRIRLNARVAPIGDVSGYVLEFGDKAESVFRFTEGTAPTQAIPVRVRAPDDITPGQVEPVTVAVAAVDGSATAGRDYVVPARTLTFVRYAYACTENAPADCDCDDDVADCALVTGEQYYQFEILTEDGNEAIETFEVVATIQGGPEPVRATVEIHDADRPVVHGLGGVASAGAVTLSWAQSVGPVTAYQVQQDGTWQAGLAPQAGTVTHTVTGLSNGQSYRFRVRAGEEVRGNTAYGEPSYEITITPPAGTAAVEVPADWTLVPPGLAPGERFRLLFVTSEKRDATATDISAYDTFVQDLVTRSGRAELAKYAGHFRVLGSTSDVDARDHVGLTGAGELIWWLGAGSMEAYDVSGRVSGTVADDAVDFFDGSWESARSLRTERGDRICYDSNCAPDERTVFTGTDIAGTASATPLGHSGNITVDTFTTTTPLSDSTRSRTEPHRFYGLSGPFVVGPAADLPTRALADDGTLRLADETTAGEGRLEYHQDGLWGTVCNDSGFNPNYNSAYSDSDKALRNVTSTVACRLLGYDDGTSIAGYGQAGVSLAEQAIMLDDVLCESDTDADGSMTTTTDDNWPDHEVADPVLLTHCGHAGPGWTFHNCNHREDVGLACSGARAGDDHTSPQVRRLWVEPPPDGVAFRRDETITVQVAFSEAVTVTGTPCLPLALRRADNTAREVDACYAGSGSEAVQPFTYEVQAGDHGPVEVPRNSLMLGASDTIRDAAGRDAIGVYDRASCTGTTTDTDTDPPTTVCDEVEGTNTMDTEQLVHHGVPPMASRLVNSERTPSAVRNLRGQADAGEVQLDWKAPADPGDEPVSGYEYAVDAGAWQKTSGAASRSTRAAQTGYQHTLTDLPPGQTYAVRVRAVNSYGGGPAAETTVQLAPDAPPPPPPPPPPLPPEEEGEDSDTDDSGDTGDTDDSGGGPGGTPGGDATQGDDPTSAEPTGYLENPGHNSFQSGIGVISGWVCEAESVEVELGHLGRQEAAYGTERADTEETAEGEELCGDTDNGFGLLFNWNLLGAGVHTVVAYVDGMELDRATVTVTTVGAGEEEEFLRDAEGECVVEDFPMVDETVRLEWQQNNQNFVITSGTRPAGTNMAGVAGRGYLENPGPDSFQSGIGVISGWVCEADEVEIAIETAGREVRREMAAYGTERADTALQRKDGTLLCGDTDNGFGLLFNWNRLGAGEHTVVAFVDGVELGRATVRVATVGEGEEAEFLRDVAGECLVEDFPMDGQTTTLAWQQNSQNFVITDVE